MHKKLMEGIMKHFLLKAMVGVALALEKCQVIQKEDRRSLYEFFSTSMITEEEYSYSDWEEDVKAKEK